MSDAYDGRPLGADNTRAIRWIKTVVWTAWGALIVFILSSAAGQSPLEPSPGARLVQLSLLPEGWSFFTRSPREAGDVVYRESGGELIRLTFSNTSARNLFGVSRSARAFAAELGALLTPVLVSSWKECVGDPAACVSDPDARPLELMNWSTTRYICGEVIIVRSPPVPWAWRRSRDRIHMDSKVLRLNVDCGQTRIERYR